MKASARNFFEGTVAAVRDGSINDEIEIETAAGLRIVATVTRESRNELGLKLGRHAFALVKAPSVVLLTDVGNARFSARNQFQGRVRSVATGAVNSEVVLELSGGQALVAVVTNDSATGLALTAGTEATAIFKASSVIVGVND
ncbi:TOBE domain-containing protein [Roseateles chitinivorans]|uniref:TOBE domain-containing protein n=1 Tax=Roseateles chitinivorans TaxID=2917965 RepID=UPI003D66E104